MKTKSKEELHNLECKLNALSEKLLNPLENAREATKIALHSFKSIKNTFKTQAQLSKQDEIEFFKNIKPLFASKVIYFNERYKIELEKLSTKNNTIDKYYRAELQKINNYFQKNIEFYKYYHSKNTTLDKILFLKNKSNNYGEMETQFLLTSCKTTTANAYKIAWIMAYEQLQQYLETEINKKNNESKPNILKWTGSKVALVELMYALHCQQVLNNGNLSLQETATLFETIFNLEMGQFHRIFIEIRNRKTNEKTNFINSLQYNLARKIEEADEK